MSLPCALLPRTLLPCAAVKRTPPTERTIQSMTLNNPPDQPSVEQITTKNNISYTSHDHHPLTGTPFPENNTAIPTTPATLTTLAANLAQLTCYPHYSHYSCNWGPSCCKPRSAHLQSPLLPLLPLLSLLLLLGTIPTQTFPFHSPPSSTLPGLDCHPERVSRSPEERRGRVSLHGPGDASLRSA